MTARRPTLVYAFDPLCGWCYGFGPAFAALQEALGDEVDWDVACGGLFVGARVPLIGEMADYLERGMAAVEGRTGVPFGDGFRRLIAEGDWRVSSEGGCRAMFAARTLFGGAAAVSLGSALCTAHFRDGARIDEPEAIRAVAEGIGLDGAALLARWDTDEAREETERTFRRDRDRGVTLYPTLYRQEGDALIQIFGGCIPAETAIASTRRELEELGRAAPAGGRR